MITEKQRKELVKALDMFVKKGDKLYELGNRLIDITEVVANIVGEQKVIINLPYHNFNCKGSAKKINEDVRYLTPFMGGNCCDINHTSTLFYSDIKCKNGTYLPFQSDCNVFHVVSCTYHKKTNDTIVINLEKGMNWRELL